MKILKPPIFHHASAFVGIFSEHLISWQLKASADSMLQCIALWAHEERRRKITVYLRDVIFDYDWLIATCESIVKRIHKAVNGKKKRKRNEQSRRKTIGFDTGKWVFTFNKPNWVSLSVDLCHFAGLKILMGNA